MDNGKNIFCETSSNFEKISLTEQERGITFQKVKTLLWMQYLSTKIIPSIKIILKHCKICFSFKAATLDDVLN